MKIKRVFMFVDDERRVPDVKDFDEIVICRTYESAIFSLHMYNRPQFSVHLALDHDLGSAETGYDIAKYVVKHKIPLESFSCHSYNGPGRKNIEDTMTIDGGYKQLSLF